MSTFNPEEFRVKFRAFFAVISFLAGMTFLIFAVFSKQAMMSKFTGPIVGFISGTMITLILTYYFGSSDQSQNNSLPDQSLSEIDSDEE